MKAVLCLWMTQWRWRCAFADTVVCKELPSDHRDGSDGGVPRRTMDRVNGDGRAGRDKINWNQVVTEYFLSWLKEFSAA